MNEDEIVQNVPPEDSNDEDTEEYFLQSTAGPYDIREKIRTANNELFENYDPCNNAREQKVTFKEELVDYEPDFSSDDGYVQSPDILSVISDNENELEVNNDKNDESSLTTEDNISQVQDNIAQSTEVEQDITQNSSDDNNSEIFVNEINNEEEINDAVEEEINNEIEEEITNEVEEEILNDFDENDNKQDEMNDENIEEIEEENSEEQIVEVVEIIQDSSDVEDCSSSSVTSEIEETLSKPENINHLHEKVISVKKEEKVICRLHCMEKPQLDVITGKPKNYDNKLKGPVLKLRQRKCCVNQPKSNLPVYNGFISEYGLTKSQLERNAKRKEKNIEKRKEKSIRIKEEKIQKDLYNEEIFRTWLKSLKNRNQPECKQNKKKKIRPKTAPHCNLSLAINIPNSRQPYTSLTCSYKIIFE